MIGKYQNPLSAPVGGGLVIHIDWCIIHNRTYLITGTTTTVSSRIITAITDNPISNDVGVNSKISEPYIQ